MKNIDLYIFREGLKSANFEHPRVTYAVNKNKRLVDTEIKIMEEHIAKSDVFKEYEKERGELAIKCAKKDKDGNPITKPQLLEGGRTVDVYVIDDEFKDEYDNGLKELGEKFKEAIEKHNEKLRSFNEEFLNEESSFEPFMLSIELMEKEVCPQHVMDKIYFMIKE